MDPATIVGMVLILLGVFVGSILKGVSPAAFFTIPAAFLIVFVASFGAVFLSNTMADAKNFFKVFLTGLKGKKLPDAGETVDLIVRACSWPSTAPTPTWWPKSWSPRSRPCPNATRPGPR
jgi:flagellar motor component MotA